MRRILALRLVTRVCVLGTLLSSAAAVAAAQPSGSFLAMKIDQAALPHSDRVTDDEGTTYLVEFDRLVLSLRAGNRFRAAVRFRRTLTSSDPRARSREAPVQSLTVNGSYVVVADEIRFTPDSSSETRGLRMLAGRVESASRISVPFTYRNGTAQRRRVLELHRRDDIR